jgi:hypothetical protein
LLVLCVLFNSVKLMPKINPLLVPLKLRNWTGTVVHTCNSSTRKAEAGGS